MADKENDPLINNQTSNIATPAERQGNTKILAHPNFNENTMFTTEAKDGFLSPHEDDQEIEDVLMGSKQSSHPEHKLQFQCRKAECITLELENMQKD